MLYRRLASPGKILEPLHLPTAGSVCQLKAEIHYRSMSNPDKGLLFKAYALCTTETTQWKEIELTGSPCALNSCFDEIGEAWWIPLLFHGTWFISRLQFGLFFFPFFLLHILHWKWQWNSLWALQDGHVLAALSYRGYAHWFRKCLTKQWEIFWNQGLEVLGPNWFGVWYMFCQ